MFTDLLNRMQSLLQREDIQVILNSMEDVKAPQKQGPAAVSSLDFDVSAEDLERIRREEKEKAALEEN